MSKISLKRQKEFLMNNKKMAIKIEKAYGNIGEIGWSYHAVNKVDNSLILEGEVERKDNGRYHMLLRPNEGGRIELDDEEDPYAADRRLRDILSARANNLLSSGRE